MVVITVKWGVWQAGIILLGRGTLPLGKMRSQYYVARSSNNHIGFHIMLVDSNHKVKSLSTWWRRLGGVRNTAQFILSLGDRYR